MIRDVLLFIFLIFLFPYSSAVVCTETTCLNEEDFDKCQGIWAKTNLAVGDGDYGPAAFVQLLWDAEKIYTGNESPCNDFHVIDVGANVGQMLTEMGNANCMGWSMTVIEMQHHLANKLKEIAQNIRSKQTKNHITVLNAGATDHEGDIFAEYSEKETSQHVSMNAGNKHRKGHLVKLITLDNYLDSLSPHIFLDFLKIDTEGWEYEVLHGAMRSLTSHNIQVIYYECHVLWEHSIHKWTYADATDFFDALGYDNFMINNKERLIWLKHPNYYYNIPPGWKNCLAVSRKIDPRRYRALLAYGDNTHPSLANHIMAPPVKCR